MSEMQKPSPNERMDLFKRIPHENRLELLAYMMEIGKTKYLKPWGKPNPEWKIFQGSTLGEALEKARSAAEAAGEMDTIMADAIQRTGKASIKNDRESDILDIKRMFADAAFKMIDAEPQIIAVQAALDASFH